MRVSDAVGTFAIVFILPEDVNIASGSPRSHRNFLDIYISQLWRPYLRSLIEYQRFLKQRNALLKKIKQKEARVSELDAWDEGLIKWSLEVMKARRIFVDEIAPDVSRIMRELSAGGDRVSITYVPRISIDQPNDFSAAMSFLRGGRSRDLRIGATLTGPHRDTLNIMVNSYPLRAFGSLGQKKSVMMAMKLAVLQALSRQRREPAILIMDEAFAELDSQRGQALLGLLSGGGQVFLASAGISGLEGADLTVFEVSDGLVVPRER